MVTFGFSTFVEEVVAGFPSTLTVEPAVGCVADVVGFLRVKAVGSVMYLSGFIFVSVVVADLCHRYKNSQSIQFHGDWQNVNGVINYRLSGN